ncbi:UBX domain protein Ubx2, partial [Teratosphaeriaceae sp. CCFEE 6253]
MDDQISTFVAFTEGTPAQAQQYLRLTDGNVEQAVELFFSNPDLGATAPAPAQPALPLQSNRDNPINLDDDEVEDDDGEMTGSGPAGGHSVEDDEAMARRLQEEMYGSGGGGGGGAGDVDAEGVRAPMARRTEALVGPDADWGGSSNNSDAMNAAVFDQLQRRTNGRGAHTGIFNQAQSNSIWAQDDPANPELQRQVLSRATGGASDTSAKLNLLAELFKPPIDLITRLPWAEARDEGKETQKWLLVNVQDPSIFDCQVLNRDLWKNKSIRDTLAEHFLFLQYNKTDPRGGEYMQYYFAARRDDEAAYPHIAIVDPRTGEQVKTWSGSPGPKASEFLMDLHEFLDRYSLDAARKNPVQGQRRAGGKKEVGRMSEEEMLEMALRNSMGVPGGAEEEEEEDPDAFTRAQTNGKGKAPAARSGRGEAMDMQDLGPVASHNGTDAQPTTGSLATPTASSQKQPDPEPTPFSLISATRPHSEPGAQDPDTTRIQFRFSGGRV